jgi:hypothetical protein
MYGPVPISCSPDLAGSHWYDIGQIVSNFGQVGKRHKVRNPIFAIKSFPQGDQGSLHRCAQKIGGLFGNETHDYWNPHVAQDRLPPPGLLGRQPKKRKNRDSFNGSSQLYLLRARHKDTRSCVTYLSDAGIMLALCSKIQSNDVNKRVGAWQPIHIITHDAFAALNVPYKKYINSATDLADWYDNILPDPSARLQICP